jgi:hypothetical protein
MRVFRPTETSTASLKSDKIRTQYIPCSSGSCGMIGEERGRCLLTTSNFDATRNYVARGGKIRAKFTVRTCIASGYIVASQRSDLPPTEAVPSTMCCVHA